jgi:hypothetical protein
MSDIDELLSMMGSTDVESTQPLGIVSASLVGAVIDWQRRAQLNVEQALFNARARYRHGTPSLADWMAYNERTTRPCTA